MEESAKNVDVKMYFKSREIAKFFLWILSQKTHFTLQDKNDNMIYHNVHVAEKEKHPLKGKRKELHVFLTASWCQFHTNSRK